MENEIKKCSTCRNFSRYYTKGTRHYLKADTGYCIKSQCNVSSQDCCKNFSELICCKQPSPKLLVRIANLFTEMTEIRSMIEEELKE